MTAQNLLLLLVDVSVKGFVLLLMAGLLTLAMKKRSATERHLVWLLAILGTLAMPVCSVCLPSWGILPHWPDKIASPLVESPRMEATSTQPSATNYPLLDTNDNLKTPPRPSVSPVIEPAKKSSSIAMTSPTWWERLTWQQGLVAAWVLGMATRLFRYILGSVIVWQVGCRARQVDDKGWLSLLHTKTSMLDIHRPVMLRESHRCTVPMTWGVLKPVVLLPSEADVWPADRRHAVLTHELAHVHRRDCLTQLIAQLAMALYWFNPLMWLAWRRLLNESERACDDLVLAQGSKASDYAEHLLGVVSCAKSDALLFSAAIAMARSSQLEGRLLAILDEKQNRRRLTRLALGVALLVVTMVVVPLSVLSAVEENQGEKDAGRKSQQEPQVQLTTREQTDLQDPFHITGTAIGEDGHSLGDGSVGFRIIGSDKKLRTAGGGIDGRNVFNLNFGPIERIAPSPKSPYGVGMYDVELFGWSSRFGYKLVKRTPSEPLRITDDPNQPELKDGIRYIRPNQPIEFKLVFTKDDTSHQQSPENASTEAVPTTPIVQEEAGKSIQCEARDAVTGKPVPGAVVKIVVRQLKDEEGRPSYREIETNTTDADSQGRFTVVVPQKYLAESDSKSEVDLFVTASHTNYITSYEFGFPRRIARDGLTDNNANFRLIKLEPSKEIFGQAVDAQGRPLAEIQIYKNYYDARNQQYSMATTQPRDADSPIRTDREGRFRTKVAARIPVALEYRTADAARNMIPVPLDSTDLGVIQIADGIRITGHVVDDQDRPVRNIMVTAPLQSKTEDQPNFCYFTDSEGRFHTDKLSPGDYLFTVGGIFSSDNHVMTQIAEAPGVYLPLLLKIRKGVPVAELTLRPTKGVVRCTATLISTRPQQTSGEQTEPISLEEEAGRKLLAESFFSVPAITVRGLVHGYAWNGRAPSTNSYALIVNGDTKKSRKASPPENPCSLLVPNELVDVTMEFGMSPQHFQLDDKSPKLFGFGIHLDRIDHDLTNIKIYRYKKTRLNVHVDVPEGKSPNDVKLQARYVREKAMTEAGSILMSGVVPFLKPEEKDGEVTYSVLPDEEIEVSLSVAGMKTSTTSVQLKDGEIRKLTITPAK